MEQACEADNSAREQGKPALQKLKMLPEVVALLNRNTVQHSIVDPDTNFLQSVKFFLEPLNDGSLPAYNIQRDLFAALTKLPIEKEALLSSGIGKVVLYYTKSKKPEIGIKRIAERLLGEWSRPILKRSDDYKKRKVVTREFDHQYVHLLELTFSVLTILQSRRTRTPPIWYSIVPIGSLSAYRPFSKGARARTCPCATQQKQQSQSGERQHQLHYRTEEHLRCKQRPGSFLTTYWCRWYGSLQKDDCQAGQKAFLSSLIWKDISTTCITSGFLRDWHFISEGNKLTLMWSTSGMDCISARSFAVEKIMADYEMRKWSTSVPPMS